MTGGRPVPGRVPTPAPARTPTRAWTRPPSRPLTSRLVGSPSARASPAGHAAAGPLPLPDRGGGADDRLRRPGLPLRLRHRPVHPRRPGHGGRALVRSPRRTRISPMTEATDDGQTATPGDASPGAASSGAATSGAVSSGTGPRFGGESCWVDLGAPVHYLDCGGPAGAPVIVAV